jgi:hypothetical protein
MIFGFVTDNKKQKQIIKIFIYLLILLEYKVYIYTFLLLAACLGACLAGESDESKQAGRQTERQTGGGQAATAGGLLASPLPPRALAK